MTEKYIEALQIVKNPIINSGYDLQSWQAKAVNVVIRIYGENSRQEEQIKEIKFRSYPVYGKPRSINSPSTRSGGGNNSKHCEKQANELIKSFIADLDTFGVPEPTKYRNNNGVNISVNQSQSQNQTVNVNIIWESIKNELSREQLKEVEEIIDDDDETGSKKKRIFEKLKSFGTDVASNIIAGILTNPTIYGG